MWVNIIVTILIYTLTAWLKLRGKEPGSVEDSNVPQDRVNRLRQQLVAYKLRIDADKDKNNPGAQR